MKTKRFTVAALLVITVMTAVVLMFTACGKTTGTYTVVTPDGAPYAGLVQMRHDVKDIDGDELSYQIEVESNIMTAMVNGSADFIVAPTNVGASVHKSFENGDDVTDYKLAAGISWGVLYIVTNRTDLTPYGGGDYAAFLNQFDGEAIDTIGRAAIPGKSLDYILGKSDATATVNAVTAPTEIVAKIQQNVDVIGVLGEPVASSLRSNPKVTVLGSVSEIYTDITGSGYPMAALFVKAALAEDKPALVSAFLEKLSASIDYFNEDPAQVAAWADEFGDSTALKPATLPGAKAYMNVAYKNSADTKADAKALLTNIGAPALALDSLFL